MADDTHKFVGNHAQEVAGHMVGPGDPLTLSKEELNDPHIKDMLENGSIISLKGGDNKNG